MKTTAMCSRSLKSWMNNIQNTDSWKQICLPKRGGLSTCYVFKLNYTFIYLYVMQIEDANSGFGTVFEHDQVITKAERSR
jgi:hypothetical protein